MVKTADLNFKPISFLQQEIMGFVHEWVVKEKTPVPQREILVFMKGRGHKKSTIVYSLRFLLREGWVREAVTRSNRTEYVECRTISQSGAFKVEGIITNKGAKGLVPFPKTRQ